MAQRGGGRNKGVVERKQMDSIALYRRSDVPLALSPSSFLAEDTPVSYNLFCLEGGGAYLFFFFLCVCDYMQRE